MYFLCLGYVDEIQSGARVKKLKQGTEIKCFMTVATVVAQLDVILDEAKSLSLTSKNARVVAIRAGESALGFKSITNFINEFSARTIRITNEINQHAHLLFKLALNQLRATQFFDHISTSLDKNSDAQAATTLNKLHQRAQVELQQSLSQLYLELQSLSAQFEEIDQQMRAAEYIAVTSRVEASQAGEYCASLESVSDYISSAAKRIKQAISTNMNTLSELERIIK